MKSYIYHAQHYRRKARDWSLEETTGMNEGVTVNSNVQTEYLERQKNGIETHEPG